MCQVQLGYATDTSTATTTATAKATAKAGMTKCDLNRYD